MKKNDFFFLKLNLLVLKSTGSIPFTKQALILLCETFKNFFKASLCFRNYLKGV